MGDYWKKSLDAKKKPRRSTILSSSTAACDIEEEDDGLIPGIYDYMVKVGNLEKALERKKRDLLRNKKLLAMKDQAVRVLVESIQQENELFKAATLLKEEKCVETKKISERVEKSIKENTARLRKEEEDQIKLELECTEAEEILMKQQRYKKVIFKALDPGWPADKTLGSAEQTSEPLEETGRKSVEGDLEPGSVQSPASTTKPTLSPVHSSTSDTDSNLDSNSAELKDTIDYVLTDPQHLMDLLSQRKDQSLSIIRNCTSEDKALQVSKAIRMKKIEEAEDRLSLIKKAKSDMIHYEDSRGIHLKRNVKLHESLKTQDQDILLNALGKKVTEVYLFSVDTRFTIASIPKKLCGIEFQMSLMLQNIEAVPEEDLSILKAAKEKTKSDRLHEMKLKADREQREEKIRKCFERSRCESKKFNVRKLMPRSFPVKKKMEVSEEATNIDEDDFYAYLFTDSSDMK